MGDPEILVVQDLEKMSRRGIPGWDLLNRSNGRKCYVPPSAVAPDQSVVVALKNRVKNTKTKDGKKACMTEMMSVIECLQKFGKDQSMCTEEIKKFDDCFVKFRAEQAIARANKDKGMMPVGEHAKISSVQLNKYIKSWPQSPRTRQDYTHPKFDPKTKYQA